ncbi:MAG: hypothetical protein KF729_02760 [Sandaracinaceae bacterium]|nr:hypothetical protein [Sandaracinaceae bacterium]
MKYALSLTLFVAMAGCASPGGDASSRPALDLRLEDRVPDDSCRAHWVAGVRGRVVDPRGAPVSEGIVQMCLRLENGSQLCQAPTPIRPDGWYTVVMPEETRCLQQVTLRASQIGRPVSTTFCRTAMTPSYGVLDVWDDLVLHPLEVPATRPPMGDEGSMRTVRFPSGLELDVTPGAFEFPDVYDRLGAGPVPLDEAPCFVEQAPGLLGLWALGPESGSLPGVRLRIPETTGLADGTRVALWLVGGTYTTLADGRHLEEGVFAPYGTGTVSGGVITSDPGSELPYLTWVGYSVAR